MASTGQVTEALIGCKITRLGSGQDGPTRRGGVIQWIRPTLRSTDDFLSMLCQLHCQACGENPELHSGMPGKTDILQCFNCRILVEITRPDKDSIFAGIKKNVDECREVFITKWELELRIKTKHMNQELEANGLPPLPFTPNKDILPNHKCNVCRI